MAASKWDRVHAHGVVEDHGSNDGFRYRAPAMYGEQVTDTRFGAFLSWPSVYEGRVLEALANRLETLSVAQQRALQLVSIDHQSAGHSCSQNCFIARPVRITPELMHFATKVCGRFYHALGGLFEPGEQFGATSEYESMVASQRLDRYDHSRPERVVPQEAIYQ